MNKAKKPSMSQLQLRQAVNLAAGYEVFHVLPTAPSDLRISSKMKARKNPGPTADSERIYRFLDNTFKQNEKSQKRGGRGTPVCIWGTHGLGKTEMVSSYARQRGWGFAYCAPAQFEEMGDLHGMPTMRDGKTIYAPPAWVPTEPGPGILLMDDFNRADDRILRGLMQLFQLGGLMSWKLPHGWHIVCTANPDGGDYTVTTVDAAMMTRMLHVTMKFEPKVWARWATASGIDPRGIAFVLTYPELITNGTASPRSLVQMFMQIEDIPDLKAQMELVHDIALSSVDEVTASAFMGFVADELVSLVSPEDILDAKDFSSVAKRIQSMVAGKGGAQRVDRMATMCARLYLTMTSPQYKPAENHAKNVVDFLLLKSMPNDLRVSLHKDILSDGSKEVVAMMRDKRLAELMLAGM